MIKRIILATMILIMVISASFAAGPQGIHDPGTGLANPETKEAAQGTGQGLQSTNESNAPTSTPGIHEPGTGLANPEVKEAAQGTGQGIESKASQAAKESVPSAEKTQPGFEAVFFMTGFIAVAYIMLGIRK